MQVSGSCWARAPGPCHCASYYGLSPCPLAPSLLLSLSLLGLPSGSGSVNPAHIHNGMRLLGPASHPPSSLLAFSPPPHASSLASLVSHLPPTLPSNLSLHPHSSLRRPHAPRDLHAISSSDLLNTRSAPPVQPLQAGEPGPVQLPEGGRRGRELRHSNVRNDKIHLRAPIVSTFTYANFLKLLFATNRSDHDIRRAAPSTPQRHLFCIT